MSEHLSPDSLGRVSSDPLDQILFQFSEDDPFTIRDACEGIQILGGIGSGKTSGSGALIARSFLNAGFGGLVLTAKPDEPDLWRHYAAQTGRSEDLVFLGPAHPARFNALRYENAQRGFGLGLTENLVELFDTLAQVTSRRGGVSSGSNEAFWRNEQRKLVRNAVEALTLARIPVTFRSIHRLVISAPLNPGQIQDRDWAMQSFCFRVMSRLRRWDQDGKLSREQKLDYELCYHFWAIEFPQQAEKTRANILGIFTGMSDIFLRGVIRELFDRTTNLLPEDTFEGKIILLDLPQKVFNEVGVFAQVLFKYCWQRAIERRRAQALSRPVFLWIDEAQYFINEHDVAFQTTARSSRVATVLLTQNIPNYLMTLGGGADSRAFVDSLLGNLVTKIFHNNTCAVTNRYASDLFAKEWRSIPGSSQQISEGKVSLSQSQGPQLVDVVDPREYSNLAKGGPPYGFQVEAIVHQGGKRFVCSQSNALRTVFEQMRD